MLGSHKKTTTNKRCSVQKTNNRVTNTKTMKGRYNTTTEKVTNTETMKGRYNTTTEIVTNTKTIDQ